MELTEKQAKELLFYSKDVRIAWGEANAAWGEISRLERRMEEVRETLYNTQGRLANAHRFLGGLFDDQQD